LARLGRQVLLLLSGIRLYPAIAALVLVAIGLTLLIWNTTLRVGLRDYASPLRAMPLRVTPATPLTPQIVLVIVDGLTPDRVDQLPGLNRLSGTLVRLNLTGLPGARPVAVWTALLTGAGPEIAGIPTRLFSVPPAPLDQAGHFLAQARTPPPLSAAQSPSNLFQESAAVNLVSVLIGHQSLSTTLPISGVTTAIWLPGPPSAADGEAALLLNQIRADYQPNLLVIHLHHLGEAASMTSTTNPQLDQALLTTDARLLAILRNLDLNRATFLIVGEGGNPTLPLLAAGRGITTTITFPENQTAGTILDLASTLAVLIGSPFPVASEGEPLWPLLTLQEKDRAAWTSVLALQQVALADAYLHGIGQGKVSDTVAGDAVVSQSAILAGLPANATRLATQAIQGAKQEMTAGRQGRLETERRQRWPVLFLVLAPLLLWIPRLLGPVVNRHPTLAAIGLVPSWLSRPWPAPRREALLGVTLALALQLTAWLPGGPAHQESWQLLTATRHGFLSLGVSGLMVTGALWWSGRLSVTHLLGTAATGFLLTVYLLILPLAGWAIWYGLTITWYLPPDRSLVWIHALQLQAGGTALAGAMGLIGGVIAGALWHPLRHSWSR